jgi:hypothetical protein
MISFIVRIHLPNVFAENESNMKHLRVVFLGLMYPALVKLFPNFVEEVKKAGGSIAPPQPVVYRGGGVVKVPLTANEWETRQLYISREVLEALLRKLVLRDFLNVTTLHGNATELIADGDIIYAVAVRLPDGSTKNIEGSVFLDCTGTTNGSKCKSSEG